MADRHVVCVIDYAVAENMISSDALLNSLNHNIQHHSNLVKSNRSVMSRNSRLDPRWNNDSPVGDCSALTRNT